MSEFTDAIENIYYAKEMQRCAENQLKELVKNGYVVSQQEYNDFYWGTDIQVALVNQFKNMKPDPIPVKMKCTECKQTKIEHVQSKCKMTELENSKNPKNKWKRYICASCRAEIYKPVKISKEMVVTTRKTESPYKYGDYKEYLQTDHWKETRIKALRRAKFRCELCNNNDKLQVHHKTYANRGNEKQEDLICLCEKCHSKFHDKTI